MVDKEYIMKGNSAILKCLIPSFVADFVYVEAWIDEEGIEIVASENNDMSNDLEKTSYYSFALNNPEIFHIIISSHA